MQQNKVSILSTRPLDELLIEKAAKNNIQIDIVSFIETVAIDELQVYDEIQTALTQTATVAFTSMNAVDAVATHLNDFTPDWKIYCIGNATKKLVIEYFGEDLISGTAQDATALAEKIIKDESTDSVFFFCGDKRRDELPAILNEHNIEVNEIQVYQTKTIKHTINKNYNGILFFSPSAVESFFRNNTTDAETVLFAIGNTTANEIKSYAENKIIVSASPGKDVLIEEMIEYFT